MVDDVIDMKMLISVLVAFEYMKFYINFRPVSLVESITKKIRQINK
jgi:hypothetical protein